MQRANIKNIDLNLLKSLDALLETESVSKAAALVNLSQPAMSRILNRIQLTLKDPLLIRSGRGMVLTPRGKALRKPVRDALAQASLVFEPDEFEPSKAEGRFRIMAPDYIAQLIMPGVLGTVLNQAPGIQIEMQYLSEAGIADMCEGKISLGFGMIGYGTELKNVASQALFEDRRFCMMRKGHPLIKDGKTISLEDFAATPQVMLSITGQGGTDIDDVLKEHGLTRKIALRVTHFMTISAVLASTDLIITVPELLAKQVMTSDLELVSPPKELQIPPFTISQIWHERFTKDAEHQWLRRLIKSACRELGS